MVGWMPLSVREMCPASGDWGEAAQQQRSYLAELEVQWHVRSAAARAPLTLLPPTHAAVAAILAFRKGSQGPGMVSDASGAGLGEAADADVPSSGLVLLPSDPTRPLSVSNHVCLTRGEDAALRYTLRWEQQRRQRPSC